jgi:hypothetical protein
MTAPERIENSLPIPRGCWRLVSDSPNTAASIVSALLGEEPLAEATVHLPRRGRIWVASFTGPSGGQIWKSTGITDREQALLVAKRWEAEARAQRLSVGRTRRKPIWRVRRQQPGSAPSGLLTQKEVALLLNMSERGVREVERRALQKLRSHPLLRQAWQEYLIGELDEAELVLTRQEIEALFAVAHTPEERGLIQKVLRLIQR